MSTRRMPREQVRDQDEDVKDEAPQVRENKVIAAFNVVKPYLQIVNSVAGVYILWVFLHFVSANLYVYYCAHASFFGALMSPLLAAAPHCRALRWVLNASAHSIDTMWLILGSWVCSKLVLVGGGAATVTAANTTTPVTETPLEAFQDAAAGLMMLPGR